RDLSRSRRAPRRYDRGARRIRHRTHADVRRNLIEPDISPPRNSAFTALSHVHRIRKNPGMVLAVSLDPVGPGLTGRILEVLRVLRGCDLVAVSKQDDFVGRGWKLGLELERRR